jgi:hypothetical protein
MQRHILNRLDSGNQWYVHFRKDETFLDMIDLTTASVAHAVTQHTCEMYHLISCIMCMIESSPL